jgi:glyoxylase-like metal-dependent hydrolase (beta-lactamase superfamily II)
VLIVGDVLLAAHPFTLVPGLREPAAYFTPDPARNRESIRRIAALEPSLVAFGHGPPMRDAARKIAEFAAKLPA